MSSDSTSKPFIELFGINLIESPFELLIIAACIAIIIGLRRWQTRKPKDLVELSPEEVSKALAAHAMAGSGPWTLSVILPLLMFFLNGNLIPADFWWLSLIALIPSLIYGSYAVRVGRRLMVQPNYQAGLAIFSANAKDLTDEALKDPEVQKRLIFWTPAMIKFMQKMALVGTKKK